MKVQIDFRDYQKIMHWMHLAHPHEVAGFGTLVVKEDALVIDDVYLLTQEATAASAEMDADAVGKLEYEVFQEAMAAGVESPPGLRWWWHSHVNMEAYWSSTDKATLRKLSQGGWMSATVFNLRGDQETCIVAQFPGAPLTEADIGFEVVYPEPSKEEEEAWKAEFEAKVTKTTVLGKYGFGYGYGPASKGTVLDYSDDDFWLPDEEEALLRFNLVESDPVGLIATPSAKTYYPARFVRWDGDVYHTNETENFAVVECDYDQVAEAPWARPLDGWPYHYIVKEAHLYVGLEVKQCQ